MDDPLRHNRWPGKVCWFDSTVFHRWRGLSIHCCTKDFFPYNTQYFYTESSPTCLSWGPVEEEATCPSSEGHTIVIFVSISSFSMNEVNIGIEPCSWWSGEPTGNLVVNVPVRCRRICNTTLLQSTEWITLWGLEPKINKSEIDNHPTYVASQFASGLCLKRSSGDELNDVEDSQERGQLPTH
jgi:hypothetical protein